MKHATHEDQLGRLRRIEGQVRGLIRMVEERRYCVDILTQVRAARAALRRVEEAILGEHVRHCVGGAVQSGRRVEREAKITELLEVLSRFSS